MSRYFFDLHECGDITPDAEGVELAGISEARDQAVIEAREIMCSEVRDGRLCLSCYIIVRDERQHEVAKVLFTEAIAVTGI